MKVIAFCNHKGGVGKTTSVASVGVALAAKGKRTLMVDLDAQSNLTAMFLQEEPTLTIYNALRGECALPVVELPDHPNLSIVASTLDMAGAELDLSARYSREYILRKLIAPLSQSYDYILLDCPPSLGLVTINALVAADDLYIPLTAEALPFKGLTKLTNVLKMVRENLNDSIALSGVIITRWESTNLSKMVEEELRSKFGDSVFSTKIRKNVAIAEAPIYTLDVITYAPQSNGAKDYLSLTDEIVSRENNNKPQ